MESGPTAAFLLVATSVIIFRRLRRTMRTVLPGTYSKPRLPTDFAGADGQVA